MVLTARYFVVEAESDVMLVLKFAIDCAPKAVKASAAVVDPVPPFSMANLPVIPVLNGNPTALVNVPDAGVPKAGEVKVGDVKVLLVNVSVPAKVANVPVTAGNVMVAEPETAGATIVAEPVLGDAPAKVTLVALAAPMVGETKVGDVLKTTEPVPVSLVIAFAKLTLVGVVKNVPTLPAKSLMSVV
jgi:hypothetical protein